MDDLLNQIEGMVADISEIAERLEGTRHEDDAIEIVTDAHAAVESALTMLCDLEDNDE